MFVESRKITWTTIVLRKSIRKS